MIRINLLPFRAARKKENVRRQVSLYFLSTFLLMLLVGYSWLSMSRNLSALEKEKIAKQNKLKSYQDTLKKIKEIEARINAIKSKQKVIGNLEKNKTGPVRLLDDLASAVPEGRLFLKSFKEKKGEMTLDGTAKDNDTVAYFMDNLKSKESISSVSLVSAKRSQIKNEENVITVTDFSIKCGITSN
jgi:type IV pilus assembly protein PilN